MKPTLISFFSLLLLACTLPMNAQLSSDSILSYQEFINNVVTHHPLAKQADLKLHFGEAQLVEAKGNFDPSLFSDWNEKNFDGKRYYRQYVTELRIPTAIGLDVVGGYENSSGDFLNPVNTTDPNGLWHLGVELDVLQGLIVNERKTLLDQAKVFQSLAQNEQRILLNELIYNASYAYLQWQLFHHFELVLIENRDLANVYFENTKLSFFGGEKTAMDTLEAHILYQDATIDLQKNAMQLLKSKLHLENFLWNEDRPITIIEGVTPEAYLNVLFDQLGYLNDSLSLNNNPTISVTLNKLSLLEIEQKLKREKLKPKLKLKYNPLLSTSENSIAPNYSIDNYTWGFVFSMPLFLRNAKGSIQQGEIKISELNLSLQNKRNELNNKITNAWEQQALLQNQQELLAQNTENYGILLEGENQKFRYGESSVFLLNKRQEKYTTTRLKLISNNIKFKIEQLKYLYYSNQLIDN